MQCGFVTVPHTSASFHSVMTLNLIAKRLSVRLIIMGARWALVGSYSLRLVCVVCVVYGVLCVWCMVCGVCVSVCACVHVCMCMQKMCLRSVMLLGLSYSYCIYTNYRLHGN